MKIEDGGPAFEKQPIQNFQWDGSLPTLEGNKIWLRSIDGSLHGWPQFTELEAVRLVLFLHSAMNRVTTARDLLATEVEAWRDRNTLHTQDYAGREESERAWFDVVNARKAVDAAGALSQ